MIKNTSLFLFRFTVLTSLLVLLLFSCRKDKIDCDSSVDPTVEFSDVRYTYNSDGTINSVLTTDEAPVSSIYYTYENDKVSKIDLQLDGGAYFSESNFFWDGDQALLKFQQENFWHDTVFIDIELNAQGYLEKYGDMSFYYSTSFVLDSIIDLRAGYNYFYQFYYDGDNLSEILVSNISSGVLVYTYNYFYTEENLLYSYHVLNHSWGTPHKYTYSYNETGQLIYVSYSDDSRHSATQTGCGVLINMDPLNFWRYYHLRLPVIGSRWH